MKIIEFKVYPETSSNITAKAFIENNEVTKVKITTKVPRGQYYSVLNDAGFEADKLTN